MLSAREEQRPEEVALPLAQALDLTFVTDDGSSMIGFWIAYTLEMTVLDAMHELLADSELDTRPVRRVLERRPLVASDRRRLLTCLQHEVAWRVELAEDTIAWENGRELVETLEMLDFIEEFPTVSAPCHELPPIDEESGFRYLLQGVRGWHSFEVRRHVARIALAANEHRLETRTWPETLAALSARFEGGLPRSPCRHRHVVLEPVDGELVIRSADAGGHGRAAEGAPEPWVLPRT